MSASVSRAVNFSPRTGFSAHALTDDTFDNRLDPFIRLDHFRMDRPIFGVHPHAGIAAVTYILPESPQGFINRDSQGRVGPIPPGGLHWTQAGSGIFHEEFPIERGIEVEGIQMFVKLPDEIELADPDAFHLEPADIPVLEIDGGQVRVLTGTLGAATSSIAVLPAVRYLDITVNPHARVTIDSGDHSRNFAFVLRGSVETNGGTARPEDAVMFERTANVSLEAGDDGARLVLCSGTPTDRVHHQYGGFFLSSHERLQSVLVAERNGDFGSLGPAEQQTPKEP